MDIQLIIMAIALPTSCAIILDILITYIFISSYRFYFIKKAHYFGFVCTFIVVYWLLNNYQLWT